MYTQIMDLYPDIQISSTLKCHGIVVCACDECLALDQRQSTPNPTWRQQCVCDVLCKVED